MHIAAAGGNGKRKAFMRAITTIVAKNAEAVSGRASFIVRKNLAPAPSNAQIETSRITEKILFTAGEFLLVSSVNATRSGGATQNFTPKRMHKNADKMIKIVRKKNAGANSLNETETHSF